MIQKNRKQPHAKAIRPAFLDAPRCGARCKRTGLPCKAPAMVNGRCRMHGGKSTGAPKGNQNALKHGAYTAEFMEKRKKVQLLIRECKEFRKEVE